MGALGRSAQALLPRNFMERRREEGEEEERREERRRKGGWRKEKGDKPPKS